MEAEAKGIAFNSAITVIRQIADANAFTAFVSALPDAERRLIERPPLGVTWIPRAQMTAIFVAASRALFGGDDERFYAVGHKQFHADLNGIYRAFIRVASPQFILARAPKLWTLYARNNGELHVQNQGPRSCDLRVVGVGAPCAAYWQYLRGSYAAGIEATGEKNVVVRFAEGGGDSPDCTMRVTW
jgi:uncharacterized protein (TIGR02265 family)